jgi:trk system potassium uptake protein TrkA
MKRKEFLVVGLGLFGASVATALKKSGCQVLAVDKEEERVRAVLGEVTHAVTADVTDPEQLQELGVKNYDGAVIAIGTDLETSILATILVKETGIPFVLAKASTEVQARVLKKVGADKIVFPEKEMGVHVATNLTMGNFFAAVELSATHSMMELDALPEWENKMLKDCDLRKKYGINVIGIRHGDELEMNPGPESKIRHNDVVIIIGKNDVLNSLAVK